MAEQAQIFDLLQLPDFVLRKIISFVPKCWYLSCTCKMLYEIVCSVEKFKYEILIQRLELRDSLCISRLTIDEDTMFKSIMNSSRLINQISINLVATKLVFNNLKLSPLQFKRILAIQKKFAMHIISIKWVAMELTVDMVIQLLRLVPNLKYLKFNMGKINSSQSKMASPEEMPRLKTIQVKAVRGFFKIADFLPDGSIIDCIIYTEDQESEEVRVFLAKQYRLKSLRIFHQIDSTFIKHLQLDKLVLSDAGYDDKTLSEMLNHQRNLKDIKIERIISGNSFKWICENLNQLEMLDVQIKKLDVAYLHYVRKLDRLRCFATILDDISDLKTFNSNSVTELKIHPSFDLGFIFHISTTDFSAMKLNFPYLRVLKIPLHSIGQLYLVLTTFPNLTKLNSRIEHCGIYRFYPYVFPNMKNLFIANDDDDERADMSIIVDFVRAMPNLEQLKVKISTKFHINSMRNFIDNCKSLKCFEMRTFVFDCHYAVNETLLPLMKSLANKLKHFRITFQMNEEELTIHDMNVMFNEFHVQTYQHFQIFCVVLSERRF